eukprot:7481246-Pyramimonas_sp.AAC.1
MDRCRGGGARAVPGGGPRVGARRACRKPRGAPAGGVCGRPWRPAGRGAVVPGVPRDLRAVPGGAGGGRPRPGALAISAP